MKIAMWSGPRNLSTAMLYAFGCRPDFAAWDEPFYAAYLKATGIDHPMREHVLQAHETDASVVAADCAGPVPDGKEHWYMKHMGFHMCEGFPLDWAEDCVNIYLIRHPNRVIASYVAKRENPTMRDIGFEQQLEIFERFPGPVIDSGDIRRAPDEAIGWLCAEIGLRFDQQMLSWRKGPKPFDGVWAKHWYGAVHASDGLSPGSEGDLPDLESDAKHLAQKALPMYQEMRAKAFRHD